VAWIRADNGKGEFGRQFQDELIFKGIEFEPCPPYKHSYNSVVKRAIYTIDCKTRSLLFEGNIPVELWCYAVEHSVWLKNRVPTSALLFDEIEHNSAITLYEAYTQQVPDLKNLAVFECHANPINTLKKHPKKYESRMKPDYVFIGLKGSSQFKMMNMYTQAIEIFGDAKVNEYRFPYKARQSQAMRQATSQATRQATSQATSQAASQATRLINEATNRPTSPSSNMQTETPVATTSMQDSDRVGRSDQDQVGRLNQGDATSGTLKGRTPVQSISIRIPHTQRTRSVRLLNTRVFNNTVVQLVIAINAVHLEAGNTTSLGAPTAPFDAIELDQALREDAPG
jgi:hypothetical protein